MIGEIEERRGWDPGHFQRLEPHQQVWLLGWWNARQAEQTAAAEQAKRRGKFRRDSPKGRK